MELFDELLRLIVEPPGSFIYSFVTLLALQAALLIALAHWRRARESPAGRLALAAALSLAARVAVLAVTLLAYSGLITSAGVLPPLDRAVSTLTILALAWALLFQQGARASIFLLAGSLLLLGIGYALAAVQWFPLGSAGEQYNAAPPETFWEVAQISLLLAALIGLLVRRAGEWGVGLALFLTLLAGHVLQLVAPDTSHSLPAAVRLAELIAMPLAAILAYRLALAPQPVAAPARSEPAQAPAGASPESAAETVPSLNLAALAGEYSGPADAETLPADALRPAQKPRSALAASAAPALAAMGLVRDRAQAGERITAAVGRLMLADLTLLIQPPEDSRSARVDCVFDIIRETHVEGFSLPLADMPTVRAALAGDRPRAIRLAPSAHASELARLAVRIGSASVGPGIVLPVVHENRLLAGLLLLSPYSGREWNADDQAVLEAILPSLAAVLQAAGQAEGFESRLRALAAQLEAAQAEVSAGKERGDRLAAALHAVEAQLERETSRANSMAAQLQTQSEAGAALEAAIAERARLEGEMRLALTEVAELTSRLGVVTSERDRLREELEALQRAAGEQAQQWQQAAAALPAPALNGQGASAEVIAAITQELRQPMSSVSGYTDLLLAESVGIIGALQRKFLERVKASIERMGTLLDDLIRVTSIDSGALRLDPQPVETAEVIDAAIMACSAQFRDKDITLRLEIADDLSPVRADQDALHQIVSHLLSNACLASAASGEVVVSADEKLVDGERQVLLSVRDTGGGIPPEEHGRVFNRLYRADNPLIPGLGETGVGLSIAKVLVESHGGRIWVESEAGVGSTFHVLLPVDGVRAAEV